MTTLDVEEIHSGVHEGSLWLSIGFRSENASDVLHVVCSLEVTEGDRRWNTDNLYLERTDQGQSGNALVDEVVVLDSTIVLRFNESGQDELGFPAELAFVLAPDLEGREAALACLQEMSRLEAGRCIRVSDSGHDAFRA